MNISWVLSDFVAADPTLDVADLKRLGSFWGSWRTWRAFQTDNVICHDQAKAAELIKREFQTKCNFYIPNLIYTNLNRPTGVNVYEGEFVHDVDHQEEIVAMHLAATTSDIVLLLGFDLTELEPNPDRLLANRETHYRNHIRQAIKDYNQIQWVVVDHNGKLDPAFSKLDNLVTDNMQTVLSLAVD
jgi:hypothetical protein